MKWVLTGCGIILGISHIGMIGMLVNRNQLPVINLPVGDYTTYTVEAGFKLIAYLSSVTYLLYIAAPVSEDTVLF